MLYWRWTPLSQPVVTPTTTVLVALTVEEPRGLGVEAATTRLEVDYHQMRLALAISVPDHVGLIDTESV